MNNLEAFITARSERCVTDNQPEVKWLSAESAGSNATDPTSTKIHRFHGAVETKRRLEFV